MIPVFRRDMRICKVMCLAVQFRQEAGSTVYVAIEGRLDSFYQAPLWSMLVQTTVLSCTLRNRSVTSLVQG